MMRTRSSAQLVALRHDDDVQGRPVEDDVGALAAGVELDAEPVERAQQRVVEDHRLGHRGDSSEVSGRRGVIA
jgi:hypothetical protein